MRHKKQGLIEMAMRNRTIVVILALVVMAIGMIALQKMPRNEFPQFTIRQGVVVGVYPGATSEEVEEQLTQKVENYIFSYQEVKKAKTYSYSREGMMYIFVELNDYVKNADQFWSKFKHGLSELKMTLPSGVLALVANSDFGDTSALLITLSSDTHSYKELEKQLEKLESECRKIPATSKIKHFGLQKEKIFVTVKPEMLNEYNIKTLSLLGTYQLNGMVNYSGILDDGRYNLSVNLPQNFESEKDLAEQIIYSDPTGNVVRLRNIATIERRYDDPDDYIKQNGRKTILLSLEMQTGHNIVEFGEDVDKALARFKEQCPEGIEVAKISELPKYVDDSVSNFMHEFLIAIVAVVLVTMVLLPFRVATVAGITVPISVLITLAFMYFFGIELHTVSLAALILVLGMIVDNSIVVIDNHVEKIDHGISPWHAAIKSAKELVAPIITATLAIMASYIPLGFMVPGTAGEFMATIPIVVSIALIVSVVVALLLVPYLNFVFIKKGLNANKVSDKKKGKSFLDRMQGWYDASIDWAFNFPKTVIAIGLAMIVGAVLLFKTIEQQLFPEMERNQFAVEVYLPSGASLHSTAQVVDSLERLLLQDERVTNVTSFVGTSSPRFHTVYAPNMPASNYGQLLVNTISDKATRAVVNDYDAKYADHFVNAHIKWKILAMQLTKSPIEIRISSDSIKDIRQIEQDVYGILKGTDGVGWVRTDWDQPAQSIRVELDKDKAIRLGLSKGLVATSLMAGLDGLPLTTIWEKDYPVEVRLAYDNKGRSGIGEIEDQYITSPLGFEPVPLRSIATLHPEWHQGTIAHRNGTRTLTISVDSEKGVVPNRVFNEIKPRIDQLSLPQGADIGYGGDYEGQIEVFVPMGIALGVSIALIFFILLFQFRKVKLSLLIMSAMLLTLPGAAIGLKLMGYEFSITAFIGITSLCGMVVRNGIILIDYARELREGERMSVHEAAIAAGKRRMRPIFLTAAAASVGVIPMILSRSPLWGPLGTVICFGLLVSMVLTLYVLPLLYAMVYRDRTQKQGFWSVPNGAAVILACLMLSAVSHNTSAQQTFTLDSCKQMALQNNKKVKEARFEIEAARQQKKEAFTNYFPKVSAMALAMRSADYLIEGTTPEMDLPVYDGNPANLESTTQFAYVPSLSIQALDYMNTVSVMAMQPVFAGGQIVNGNKMASAAVDIRQKQLAMTESDVLVRTEELYWNTVALYEKRKTVLAYQQMLETLARDVKVSTDAGLVHRSDLLRVQLEQTNLRNNLLKLNNGIYLSKLALIQHAGMGGVTPDELVLDTMSVAVQPVTLPELQSGNVQNRREYQMLDKAVEISKLEKHMAFGEHLPQLAVGATGFTYDAMDNTASNALVFATVSIPISDWWGGSHKVKQKQIRIQAAQEKLGETAELLALQMQQTRQQVEEAYWETELAKEGVAQADEHFKVVKDNHDVGVATTSDLLEAQAMHQQALDRLTDARCKYHVSLAKYKQAMGE
ncbi:MAG: efflux RND transporter permease subunit [Breznakibacter sp.]